MYEIAHSIIDDHSRLAYTELHADERSGTVVGFVERALAFFAGQRGGTVVRAWLTLWPTLPELTERSPSRLVVTRGDNPLMARTTQPAAGARSRLLAKHGFLKVSSARGIVNKRQLIPIVIAVLSLAAFSGCASDDAAVYEERSSSVIEECREHGGVAAFDDDIVICRDQTANEERGLRAVEACRGHGGVVAFDDDIVICGDHTVWEAEES